MRCRVKKSRTTGLWCILWSGQSLWDIPRFTTWEEAFGTALGEKNNFQVTEWRR